MCLCGMFGLTVKLFLHLQDLRRAHGCLWQSLSCWQRSWMKSGNRWELSSARTVSDITLKPSCFTWLKPTQMEQRKLLREDVWILGISRSLMALWEKAKASGTGLGLGLENNIFSCLWGWDTASKLLEDAWKYILQQTNHNVNKLRDHVVCHHPVIKS